MLLSVHNHAVKLVSSEVQTGYEVFSSDIFSTPPKHRGSKDCVLAPWNLAGEQKVPRMQVTDECGGEYPENVQVQKQVYHGSHSHIFSDRQADDTGKVRELQNAPKKLQFLPSIILGRTRACTSKKLVMFAATINWYDWLVGSRHTAAIPQEVSHVWSNQVSTPPPLPLMGSECWNPLMKLGILH
jgi:hypothetical protein